jgi:hypothetical protein
MVALDGSFGRESGGAGVAGGAGVEVGWVGSYINEYVFEELEELEGGDLDLGGKLGGVKGKLVGKLGVVRKYFKSRGKERARHETISNWIKRRV